MKLPFRITAPSLPLAVALLLLGSTAWAADLKLTGDSEVPPVKTAAHGNSTIAVAADGAVAGSVNTTGIAGTMAHIHLGSIGKNGPVIVPLTKGADGEWAVPPGAKLTSDQLKSYKSGDLYVNVHSEAHKGGEIRVQLTP
jgi:hypothetical protein